MQAPAAQPPVQNLDEVLARLRAALPELQRRYPIARLGVFGSFARGEQRPDSDVDVLVESDQPLGAEFLDLADEVERMVGKQISIVTATSLPPWWRAHVLAETIYAQ